MKLLKALFLTGVLLCLLTHLPAQQRENQVPSQAPAVNQENSSSLHTAELYDRATAEQEPLFSGAEYRRFPYQYEIVNGIIYFGSNNITRGDLIYFDRRYNNIPLLYDQHTDELITVNIDGNAFIRLFSPQVKSFRIYGCDFIYSKDSVNMGFWQVLINSKTKLLKKEIKTLKQKIVDHKIAPVLKTQTLFRIVIKDESYNIANKEAIKNTFHDQREAIGDFMKKNRKRFRKSSFETMVKETVDYYNQLTASK